MIIDDFVSRPGSWLSVERDAGIVVSSRVRLARNLKGAPFPKWASKDECARLCNKLRKAFEEMPIASEALFLDIDDMSEVDREILKERHLISREFAENGAGRGLIVAKDERIAIMINEEDHIRLQGIWSGMNLPAVWRKVDAADTELERFLDYAFSHQLGYLTACPSNVGTGLRASVMMHLPGLKLLNEIGPVVKGLDKIGLAVRGLLGEGTEAYGNMFQISNQRTMGETEQAIIDHLIQIISELIDHEQNARARLMEKKKNFVFDQVGRAFGILTHAMALPSQEAVDLLSALRLGVELELVKGLTVGQINEIMLLTQPGHLQKLAGSILGHEERDEMRAGIVRCKLMDVSISE